jgi:hypothetical protein
VSQEQQITRIRSKHAKEIDDLEEERRKLIDELHQVHGSSEEH